MHLKCSNSDFLKKFSWEIQFRFKYIYNEESQRSVQVHALLAKQLVHFDSGTPTFSLTSLTNTCVRHLHQNAPSSMVGEDTCRVRPSVDF